MGMIRQFREYLKERKLSESIEEKKRLYAKVFSSDIDYALIEQIGKSLPDGYSVEIILPGQEASGSKRIVFHSPRSRAENERANHW